MNKTTETKDEQSVSRQFAKLAAETKEAAQDMQDYIFAQKNQFADRMEKQLVEIRRDLDRLSSKIGACSDAAKSEAEPKLQSLRDQADHLNKQLDDAKGASESTWSEVKGRCNKVYLETVGCIQQSRQWLSSKIAP